MFIMGSFLALLRLKKKSVVQNANRAVPNEGTSRMEYRQERERRRSGTRCVNTVETI